MAAALPPNPVAVAAPPPPQTVVDARTLCGINNAQVHNALGNTAAQRVATEIFSNNFGACMDLTDAEINDGFKAFTGLTSYTSRTDTCPVRC